MANRWNRGSNNYYPNNYGMSAMPYYIPQNDRQRYGGNNYGGNNKGYYRDDKKREDRKRPHSPSKDRHGKGDRDSVKRGGKYDIRVPRNHIAIDRLTSLDIRSKLPRLSVPGDFSNAICDWTKGFPLYEPLGFSMDADFHLFHREVEVPFAHDSSLIDIADADFTYSARVMMLGTPSLGEIYKNSCKMADEVGDSVKYSASKNYNFLLGGRVRNEAIPLGGPWSPSLDGANPEKDPNVLIKTAIRNFKGLTGVDLSGCTRWINFLTLKYHRKTGTKAPHPLKTEERSIDSDCIETVVFFIPVLNSLLPSEAEWQLKKDHYAGVLNRLLNPEKTEETEEKVQNGNSEVSLDDSNTMNESVCVKTEPTHFEKLDTSTMKVNELRAELVARNLDSKGLKNQLQARLQEAIEQEKLKAEAAAEQCDQEENCKEAKQDSDSGDQSKIEPIVVDEEKSGQKTEEMSERDRRRLERLYRLESKPCIIIHPNTQAKDNTFDCHRASLCSLLDYRHDEVNEMNFEVVLFAQQFHEMLLRDSVFNIFKAFYLAPESTNKSEIKENGESEPDNKRLKEEENGLNDTCDKVRKHKRTVDPELLYSFCFFDTGQCEYIKELDLLDMFQLIDTGLTKNELKDIICRTTKKKDHFNYRNLCDKEVVQNSEEDIVNLKNGTVSNEGLEKIKSLISQFRDVPSKPSQIVIGGNGSSANLTQKFEEALKAKKAVELQFFKLKDEFENVRIKMNGFQDVEDSLRSENSDLHKKLKSEQKNGSENRSLVTIYSKILKDCKFHLDKSLGDINRQFEKEKEKRDAEKAELDKKLEEQKQKDDSSVDKKDDVAEIVVDTA